MIDRGTAINRAASAGAHVIEARTTAAALKRNPRASVVDLERARVRCIQAEVELVLAAAEFAAIGGPSGAPPLASVPLADNPILLELARAMMEQPPDVTALDLGDLWPIIDALVRVWVPCALDRDGVVDAAASLRAGLPITDRETAFAELDHVQWAHEQAIASRPATAHRSSRGTAAGDWGMTTYYAVHAVSAAVFWSAPNERATLPFGSAYALSAVMETIVSCVREAGCLPAARVFVANLAAERRRSR